MTLTEARSLSHLEGAERSVGGTTVLIHRSHHGYHLTRSAPDDVERTPAQRWVPSTLDDLLVFARDERFTEVDAEATDWRAISGEWRKM